MAHVTDLRSVRIQRFRGLDDLELNDMGLFNVLVGPNDVGKTTVLEALYTLVQFGDPEVANKVQSLRHIDVTKFEQLRLLFAELSDTPIKISAQLGGVLEYCHLTLSPHVRKNHRNEFQPTKGVESARLVERVTSNLSPTPDNRYNGLIGVTELKERDSLEPLKITMSVVIDDRRIAYTPGSIANMMSAGMVNANFGYDVGVIDHLVMKKKEGELVGLLQKINPRIERVASVGDVIYVDVGLSQMVPLNVFGTGMARAVTLAAMAIAGEEQLLLIDEFGNGLHHSAMTDLLKVLLEQARVNDTQTVLTTHNIDALRSLQTLMAHDSMSDLQESIVCYKLQRDYDDHVRAYRYDFAQFDHCIKLDVEIR